MRLDGKVALVIGAGSMSPGEMSNGKATSITFGRAGAKVVAVDLLMSSAEETAREMAAEGLDCTPMAADCASVADMERVVTDTMTLHGRIDVLHNNVGLLEFGSHVSTDEAKWDRVMAVNVRSIFTATRLVIPHMIVAGGGSIVNVSALASQRYLGPAITYTTSKAAVNGLTLAIALEHAKKGIRCNAVVPGFIDTPVGLSVYKNGDPQEAAERKALRDAKMPTGSAGTPWDIANAALFLASDASKYVNGLLLPVDGGIRELSPTAVI